MTTISQYWQWYFPGGWTGVTVAGLVLLLLVMVSYRFTMREVRRRWKLLLVGCRTLFLALLLFGLCRPALVTEKTEVSREVPTVAVMVDESGSMRCRGYDGRSRLDEAERAVRRLQERSRGRCEFKLFGFSRRVRAVEGMTELRRTDDPESPTALFAAVAESGERLWAENVKAAIWISDGVDTAGGRRNDALAALAASPIPQVWLEAAGRLPGRPGLELVHLECPGEVRPGAMFNVLALVRKRGQLQDGRAVFTVRHDGREVIRRELAMGSVGNESRAVRFSLSVPREGTGTFVAELRSTGLTVPPVHWQVEAVPAVDQKILLYQGELTFDQAFLRRIFSGDKRAQLAVRFAADVLGSGNSGNRKLGRGFPAPDELAKYNVIILNAIRHSQLSGDVERRLQEFVRGGGSLLFMAVNNEAAGQFAASALEEILPVKFEPGGNFVRQDAATGAFLRQMQEYRRANGIRRRSALPPLRPFEITADGLRSRIFSVPGPKGEERMVPEYQEFALAGGVKPGAILLAVAPGFQRNGQPCPLLAVQNYGRGRSAVICSDSLWHWKLSLPSADRQYECFWQNLLLWLSAGNSARPAWVLHSYVQPAGKPASVQFRLPADLSLQASELVFEARPENGGPVVPLRMNAAPGRLLKGELAGEPGVFYRLTARKGEQTAAESGVGFTRKASDGEMDNLASDPVTLAELARASGSVLLDDESKIDWDALLPPVESRKVSTANDPLWHRPWIFLLMLGALVTELLVRRRCKLV